MRRSRRWSRSCGRSAVWCEKGCEVHAPDLGLDGASGERDSAAIRVQADAALPVERDAKPLRFAAFERYTPEAGHRLARSADQQMAVVSSPLHAADAALGNRG